MSFPNSDALKIGHRRELFWDDTIIDTKATTTNYRLHTLTQQKEPAFTLDREWEGDESIYYSILKDGDIYRIYYITGHTSPYAHKYDLKELSVCYAESRDGIHWDKPSLGICEFHGSKENNLIFDHTVHRDNFMVMIDSSPYCKPGEKYKAIGLLNPHCLWSFVSEDGIHFRRSKMITDKGSFDSLNTVLWDEQAGLFRCYYRDFHHGPVPDTVNPAWWRDIHMMTSPDFEHWSEGLILKYGTLTDYQLYTNNITKYYRADHVFAGFPVRYIERQEWTSNYDALCGVEKRKDRMKFSDRYGLAMTDCLFMTSRDGLHWNRYDEAFFRPGPEHPNNWYYGNCYLAYGMIETPGTYPGTDPEISMYCPDNRWSGETAHLMRYTIRRDGFVSQVGGFIPKRLVTKPFFYDGGQLFINFSTSAAGYIRIILRGPDGALLTGAELFGDSTNRLVQLTNGDLSKFLGKPIILDCELCDAEMYSFIFK